MVEVEGSAPSSHQRLLIVETFGVPVRCSFPRKRAPKRARVVSYTSLGKLHTCRDTDKSIRGPP